MSRYEFPSRLDLRHLRYFIAIAELENFHRASESLNVVQSALSRRMLDLEKHLAVTLLERSSKGVTLTGAGAILLGHARNIIGEAERTKAYLKKLAACQTGLLRFGLNRIAPQLPIVSRSFQAFRQSHANVKLDLHSMTSREQLEALLAGEIDFGFLTNGSAFSKKLRHLTIFKDYFILALPFDHPLATAKQKIRLRDLAEEDLIFITRSTGRTAYDSLFAAFTAQGITPRIIQESHSEDSHLGLVAAGMGLTFTYSSIIDRYHRPDLVFKPVEDLDVDIDIDLVWRKTDHSPLLKAFLKQIESEVARA